ncbi:unnamed protein product, partial [Protopolystoma xenopodis]
MMIFSASSSAAQHVSTSFVYRDLASQGLKTFPLRVEPFILPEPSFKDSASVRATCLAFLQERLSLPANILFGLITSSFEETNRPN